MICDILLLLICIIIFIFVISCRRETFSEEPDIYDANDIDMNDIIIDEDEDIQDKNVVILSNSDKNKEKTENKTLDTNKVIGYVSPPKAGGSIHYPKITLLENEPYLIYNKK
jgi:hypothetical protein